MAAAASCLLKYMWYTAYSTAWYGHPRFAQREQLASSRASLYLWITVVLEITALAVVCSLIRLRYTGLSQSLKIAVRLAASAAITIAGTALLTFALSWMQLGMQ